MKDSVYCIVNTPEQAESIVLALREQGFTNDAISALLPDNSGSKDFAHEHRTKAPEGATTGGVAGLAVGAVIGWLAGVGTLAILGLGPFISAGPIMAALSGAALGAAAGGIIGGLVGMGMPEFEAKRYDAKVGKGNILISVHVDRSEQRSLVKDIFRNHRAVDIASAGEATPP